MENIKMNHFRIILKNKSNTGIVSIDLKSNNIYAYLRRHEININDVIKIIQYKEA